MSIASYSWCDFCYNVESHVWTSACAAKLTSSASCSWWWLCCSFLFAYLDMHKICLFFWTFSGLNMLISFLLIKKCVFYKHWYMTSWLKSRSQFTMFLLLTLSNYWWGRSQVFWLAVLKNFAKLQENTCVRASFQ